MSGVHDTPAWVMLAYLFSGVCFILALRGLSSPSTSQRGNRLGMIGMAVAVLTTLVTHMPRLSQPAGPMRLCTQDVEGTRPIGTAVCSDVASAAAFQPD